MDEYGKRATVKMLAKDGTEAKGYTTEKNFHGGETVTRKTKSLLGPLSTDAANIRRKSNKAYWALRK